jgi:2-amino-4-hydroxy-6-hydroxymethyldihydropteridine diphosphokinase
MSITYLSIGGNTGDRLMFINKARDFITNKIGKIKQESGIYETEPWGFTDNNYFLNIVILVETDLNFHDLLKEINSIEKECGRERSKTHYCSRTIDVDILFFDNIVFKSPDLTIPHPLLQERKFILIPLNDISPGLIHPVLNKSVKELLAECNDNSDVRIF